MKGLGTVNGFVLMAGIVKGKRFTFDGTTLGLTLEAIKAGAVEGDEIVSELGTHYLEFNQYESRVPQKLWANRFPVNIQRS
jgi:hypothetical protein